MGDRAPRARTASKPVTPRSSPTTSTASCETSEPARPRRAWPTLQDYNTYDCLSTLRLRDWLLERADEAGVRDQIVPRIKDVQGEELSDEDPVFVALMAKSGPKQRIERTPEEQAYAMLATAHRLLPPRAQAVLVGALRAASATRSTSGPTPGTCSSSSRPRSSQDWAVPDGQATNARRVLRLTGDWAPGSKTALGRPGRLPDPEPARVVRPGRCAVRRGRERRASSTRRRRPACRAADREPQAGRDVHRLPGRAGPRHAAEDRQDSKRRSRRSAQPQPPRRRCLDRAALDILARRTPRLMAAAPCPPRGVDGRERRRGTHRDGRTPTSRSRARREPARPTPAHTSSRSSSRSTTGGSASSRSHTPSWRTCSPAS